MTLDFRPVAPTSPLAVQAVGRYFAEVADRLAFDATGEADKDARLLAPPTGIFVVAVADGEAVACGGVQTLSNGVGEIKRMWVSRDRRGAGLGSRLLRELEARAVSLGHSVLRLDTNAALTEVIALYERASYARIERYNDNPYATHFFQKRLAAAM